MFITNRLSKILLLLGTNKDTCCKDKLQGMQAFQLPEREKSRTFNYKTVLFLLIWLVCRACSTNSTTFMMIWSSSSDDSDSVSDHSKGTPTSKTLNFGPNSYADAFDHFFINRKKPINGLKNEFCEFSVTKSSVKVVFGGSTRSCISWTGWKRVVSP